MTPTLFPDTNVGRQTWGIASPVEYDVPKCNSSVPGCKAVPGSSNPHGAEGKEWIHTITGTYKASGKLVAAHFHCVRAALFPAFSSKV